MNAVSAEDKQLFAQAVSGATPLERKNRADTSLPKPKRRPIKTQQHIELNDPRFSFSAPSVSANEHIEHYEKGFRLQDLSRLRKREFDLDGQLDLHGEQETSAQSLLTHFIAQHFRLGHRHVLIIHGKGHNASGDHPILKNLVNQVLRQLPEVLAFTSAQPKDGGTGAVYVRLKVARPERLSRA